MAERKSDFFDEVKYGGIVTNVSRGDWRETIKAEDRANDIVLVHRMPVGTKYWDQSRVTSSGIAGVTIDLGVRQVRPYGEETLFEDPTYFAADVDLASEGSTQLFNFTKFVRVPADDPNAVSVRGHEIEHEIIMTLKGSVAAAAGGEIGLYFDWHCTGPYD